MDVSVIIVNYNTWQMTAECIDSVFEKTIGIDFEVILVDNGSIDGSKEHFENDLRITYVYSNENLGFGCANNLGFTHASGRYIFLLNSDTLLLNNAIKEFYDEASAQDENVGFWGCYLSDRSGNIIHSGGSFPKFVDFLFHHRNLPITNQVNQIIDYVTGADLFIKRDILSKSGFFDPDFFMYFEETELQLRYNKLGIKSKIICNPQIMHLCPAANSKTTVTRLQIYVSGKFVYAKKVFNRITYYLLRILSVIYYPIIINKYMGTTAQKLKFLTSLFR